MKDYLLPLALPLGLVWMLLVLAFVWRWVRRRRIEALLPGGLALALTVLGGTPLPAWLLASLERPHAGVDLEALPKADAVVMLGGLLRVSPHDVFGADFTQSIDRAVMAVELVRRGKAPALVLGGGQPRGAEDQGEQGFLVPWIDAWGVKPAEVHDLGPCRDTRDEAIALDCLAGRHGWERILLVTSAGHMRRAAAVFEKHGIEVIRVAADFQGMAELGNPRLWSVVPRAGTLKLLDDYLYEIIGWQVYRSRGWVGD